VRQVFIEMTKKTTMTPLSPVAGKNNTNRESKMDDKIPKMITDASRLFRCKAAVVAPLGALFLANLTRTETTTMIL
jgi:hypothetical protein